MSDKRTSCTPKSDHIKVLANLVVPVVANDIPRLQAFMADPANRTAMQQLSGNLNEADRAQHPEDYQPTPPPVGDVTIVPYVIGKVYPQPYPSSIQQQMAPGPIVAYEVVVPEFVPLSDPPRRCTGVRIAFGAVQPNDQVPCYGNISFAPGVGSASAPVSIGGGQDSVSVAPGTTVYGNLRVGSPGLTVFSAFALG